MSRSDQSPERTPENNITDSQHQQDIILAHQLGMSVEDMYEMFEEVNRQIEEEELHNEWPNLTGEGNYTDEGFEESYAG